MGLTATLVLLALALGVGAFARWRAARPTELGRVRYVPYTAILYVAVVLVIVLIAHLLTLAGLTLPNRR